MARRFATRIGAIRVNRFARIDSQKNQKNPRVRKIRVCNSGAGNGCANFMDAWKKCVLSAGKPLSIKFLALGGGILGLGGGGKCRFYFYGRGDFSEKKACFHNARAIRVNRLKTTIRNF